MFNIGDRVKVVGYENYNGETGEISQILNKKIEGYDCVVTFDNNRLELAFNFDELELIYSTDDKTLDACKAHASAYYGEPSVPKVSTDIQVRIKRLSPDSVVPTYATPGSACFDLVASEDVLICPGETKAVSTGIAMEIPKGYQMKIHPRSGISLKTPLRIANAPGCVDEDFRNEVKVLLWNTLVDQNEDCNWYIEINGCESRGLPYELPLGTYGIRKGDRIAQAEIVPVLRASFTEVDSLSTTDRTGGFGSTGVR